MTKSYWIRAILVALLATGLRASKASAQSTTDTKKTPLTTQQALQMHSISDLHFSPDGVHLAFVVSEPPKGAERAQHVWMLDVKTHELRQFTNSAKSDSHPRWAPDGRVLAFISNRDDQRQIYLISTEGGEAARLTEGKQDIRSFEWSPDGKQIAFLAVDAKTEVEEKKEKDKDDARVVDRDDKHPRVWLLDLASKKSRALTAPNWQISEAEWAAQGNRLIVSATDHPESDDNTSRIFSVELSDGSLRQIAAPRGPFGDLRVAPDGVVAAYVGSRGDGPSPHDLFVQPLGGGASHNLTAENLDRPILMYHWRANGTLLALTQEGFETRLAILARDHAPAALGPFEVSLGQFDESAAGMLAFVGSSSTEQEELWLRAGNNPAQCVSKFNENWSRFVLQKPEFFRYKSFDGLQIEGALIKPPTYDGKSKLPLVVLIHGGPTGAWRDTIEPWGQLLAAHGYAVFYPNIRGSTGYGEKFIEMNRGDWGGGDFLDVMAGVDHLIAQGIADPERLGIGGWSYGGYMAEWAVTQTNRFKAAVSGAGMANLASEFGTETHPSYDKWFYGLPYENMQGFLKSSPITYMKSARTPTLILQGEADVTDPLGQSQELYRGLKFYGAPADLVVYPREGHGLREEKHQLDRLNRILAWFDAHLK